MAQQNEPVACPYCKNNATLGAVYYDQNCVGCVKRMTHPQQRTWVGLTDEEKESLINKKVDGAYLTVMETIELTEAKLMDKNL